ncbi:MAG: FHA domain-containing protein [Cyanobacteria bacterium Co-bin8]|nr:FHA domain-containing protein [Cyanobacteria bacterium Co-bin8]
MKLSIYFVDNFPVKNLAGTTKEIDPDAYSGKAIFLMGRHPECDFHVPHKQVSARHCAFRYTPPSLPDEAGRWEIADWGSANGTYFKGKRLESKNWEPIEAQDRFFLMAPSLTCVIVEENDTLQAEQETIVQSFPAPEPVAVAVAPPSSATTQAPQRTYTYGDALYEVAVWLTRAHTPAGTAFRFIMAALAAAIVVIVIGLIL